MNNNPSNPSLVEEIVRYGELAYDPMLSTSDRSANLKNFDALLKGGQIMRLLPALTTLVQIGRVQTWLRPHLMQALALLPLRPRGVRSVIEFVISVHPSTAPPPSSKGVAAESRGPSISLEALTSASRLISTPPRSMSPDEWFSGIAPQLLGLLDGQGGLEMVKASAYIIGYGILGRKEYGAPGSAGWKAFAVPMLGCIDPTFINDSESESKISNDEIINLSTKHMLVSASQLAEALRRLASLLSSHPNPGLSKRLLGRLLLPLWSLASWPAKDNEKEEWRAPAMFLLQILLQLSDAKQLIIIAENLMFYGKKIQGRLPWRYKATSMQGIIVEKWLDRQPKMDLMNEEDLEVLDRKVETFVVLLQATRDDSVVPALFLSLCKQWVFSEDHPQAQINICSVSLTENTAIAKTKFVVVKIMEKMMSAIPGTLISDITQVLELVGEVLHQLSVNDDESEGEETASVALSLLNLVFLSSKFQHSQHARILATIQDNLGCIISTGDSDLARTAQNLLLLLDAQRAEAPVTPSPIVDKNEEERRTYKLAMSYLMSSESPPPVRAQGLDLLSDLMRINSPVLDIPATLILLSSLLQDEEEYIYLRCIKVYILISVKHPKSVMESLLDHYVDVNEEATLDARLRVGEALLQVIEKAGQAFGGPVAQAIGACLLSIAGRRGNRPKTQEAREKREAIARNQTREAEQAWEGPVPQLEAEGDDAGQEVLEQIVGGWEGSRGEEDVRVRASALAILGTAIEVNIGGLGSSTTSSGVDLSINILAMEPEPAKAILRRSAILLVMSLIRALDTTKPGFGFAGQSLDEVIRILRYIESTDNDGLVRQHAKDVIEGLETWQMKSLVEASRPQAGSSLLAGGLAGLSFGSNPSSKRKARIEEIE
ncbi:MAG: hypothetical protein M1818_001854 [Claussenomyces sp. TS43310]|nr:MAG: hypothetical protein M1818_001854 [Claussenomyces sp. TS43310]